MPKYLTKLQRSKLESFFHTVIENKYIPQEPTEKQATFLVETNTTEGFYGGAARGGKSSALLIAALQYVEEPDYAALLFRRTYKDLALEDAIMDRADQWLRTTDARWEAQDKRWRFPSGATLAFGYLDTEKDKYRYQSAAYQFIGFDELTHFMESQYLYLFSRLTRLEGSKIPLRMRAASNPGGVGHEWVKARFITPTQDELQNYSNFFIPAYLQDNPHVDQKAYEEMLNKLDPVTREQLRHGNWDISLEGNMFKQEWFEFVTSAPTTNRVRYWDMAASAPKKGTYPDWTVGCLMSESKGIFFIEDIVRFQKTPADSEKIIKQTAQMDGIETKIRQEQEPGASGLIMIDHYARDILKGFAFQGSRITGSKVTRAQPLSAAAENGNIKIKRGAPWIGDLISELIPFPTVGVHDDMVDAASGAFNELNMHITGPVAAVNMMTPKNSPDIPSYRGAKIPYF